MAKNKLQGYFFMSINNGELNVNSAGDINILSAAFATILTSDDKEQAEIKSILSVAVAIAAKELSSKEKYSSKTAKKVAKPQPIKKVAAKRK